MPLTPEEAVLIVAGDAPKAIEQLNKFSFTAFRTRGGRLGSGMGILLEALFVYFMNAALRNEGGEARECEIAWLEDHEPNDFACVHRDADWVPGTRKGELFRIEAKSMNIGVDESKGHFSELVRNIGPHDQLLVLTWRWEKVDDWRVYPMVEDFIVAPALPIANLRDDLHIERGGHFVQEKACPDSCIPQPCTHVGEPINEAGVRERISGPASAKGANVSAANNFGGLVRMLKTNNESARRVFQLHRKESDVAHAFVSFIHKNYPAEEANQYPADAWKAIAADHGLEIKKLKKDQVIEMVRSSVAGYRDLLRNFKV